VSIEPKLEEVKGNKWTLSFIVLAKKMINFKELCRQIYDAISGMQCITLIISIAQKGRGDGQLIFPLQAIHRDCQ
jgi:hypothetical protein